MSASLTRYPMDFSSLSKGSWLETGEICDALNLEPSDKHWGLKVMGLIEMIHDQCGILARQEDRRVRLMSDVEASAYEFRIMERSVRRTLRCAENQLLIDPGGMNPAELATHDARARVIVATAVAASSEKQKQSKIEGLLSNGTIVGERRLKD